jgi:hypothetical protein
MMLLEDDVEIIHRIIIIFSNAPIPPHLMDVECFSPEGAAEAAMATRLVSLSREKGPRRFDGKR